MCTNYDGNTFTEYIFSMHIEKVVTLRYKMG